MAIQRLSEDLVNQIAAGEVVERPAHLVKELVENSLDAGATEIEVAIENGGRTLTIKDNGSGIPTKELALALERHSTSKISAIDDLWKIGSFGFRGEALASAASVCHLQLISRPASQKEGSKIEVEFGKLGSVEATGSSVGTTLQIDKLFENIPARLKFLKSDTAETTQIKNTLKSIGLAHHNVTFRVRVNGALTFFWPATETHIERVKIILEQDEVFEILTEVGGFKAQVFACSPNVTFQQSKKIWTFVKSRWVQDRGLQAAVTEAYRNLLMHGEYPIAVVFVDCPPSEVDVNIHPTKSQVKFRDASAAFRVVHRAVRDLLEKAPWLKNLLPERTTQFALEPSAPEVEEVTTSFSEESFTRTQYKKPTWNPAPLVERPPSRAVISENVYTPSAETRSSENTLATTQEAGKWSSLDIVGQAHLTYIICQNDHALIYIDQHAAHERVMFEKFSRGFTNNQIEIQAYLFPLSVDIGADEMEALLPHLEALEDRMGLSIDQAGPETLNIRAAPAMSKEDSLPGIIKKLAQEMLERGESFVFEKSIADAIATLACHSAIRAGKALTTQEMRELLIQMDEYPLSSFCPHGRPVYVETPFEKIERDFGRLV